MSKLKYVPQNKILCKHTWFTNWPSYWPKLRGGGQEIKKSIGIAQKILLHVILVLQKFPGSI